MSKVIDFKQFDAYFVDQVKSVISEGDRHKYSVSRVYAAYNRAYGRNDKPQTCSSCLRNRVRELRKWYEDYKKYASTVAPELPFEGVKTLKGDEGNYTEVTGEPIAAPSLPPLENTLKIKDKDGNISEALFNSNDGVKGTLLYGDGSKVKAGTYTTDTGDIVAVQPGGKATIKTTEEDLL